MNRQPQLMDRSQMQHILAPDLQKIRQQVYFDNELGIVHGDSTVFKLIMKQKPPFIINDHRLGVILNGEACINFNLQDRHLTAGTLAYLGPGTIIMPHQFSNNFEIRGVILFSQFPMPFAPGQMPSAFNGQVRDFQIPPHRERPADGTRHHRNALEDGASARIPSSHSQRTCGSINATLRRMLSQTS